MWHDWPVTADDVQRWLDALRRAWASYDEAEIAALFTDDAAYRYDPFCRAARRRRRDRGRLAEGPGRAGIVGGGVPPFAVGRRPRRRRRRDGVPAGGQRYANTYVLEFAADGRCSSFTEWFFLERQPETQAATGSNRSLVRPPVGTLVGYSRVKQARQTEPAGSFVADCMPSSER